MNNQVVVLVGAGEIGIAIARRISIGKKLVLADVNENNLNKQYASLKSAGFDVTTKRCDVSSKESICSLASYASSLGVVKHIVNTAGLSPSQASVEHILNVDLYGNAVILEEFGSIIGEQGTGLIIGSQSSHRLEPLNHEIRKLLALTPADELLNLDFIKEIDDTLLAYQISKYCGILKVQSEALKWGERGARLNSISAGIVYTPLANDELNGERKDFYQAMLKSLPIKRGGTVDEIAHLAEFISSEKAGYITGSDFLIDGGSTSKFWWGN